MPLIFWLHTLTGDQPLSKVPEAYFLVCTQFFMELLGHNLQFGESWMFMRQRCSALSDGMLLRISPYSRVLIYYLLGLPTFSHTYSVYIFKSFGFKLGSNEKLCWVDCNCSVLRDNFVHFFTKKPHSSFSFTSTWEWIHWYTISFPTTCSFLIIVLMYLTFNMQ